MWELLLPFLTTAGGSLLSALGGNKTTDATQNWLSQFNSANGFDKNNRDLNAARSNSFYDLLTQGNLSANNAMGQSNYYGNMAGNLLGQAQQSANRSASDILNAFTQTQPAMTEYANQVANQAMTQNGASMNELANLQSNNAIRNIENMLSRSGQSANSGAALAALSRGAAEPLLNTQSQLGQMRSNAFQNAYSPMAQAGYGAELNRTNDLMNLVSGAQNLQGTYGSLGANLGNLLAQQSEQQILAPSLQTQGDFMTTLGGALTGVGSQALGNSGILSLLSGNGIGTPSASKGLQNNYDAQKSKFDGFNFSAPYGNEGIANNLKDLLAALGIQS